MSAANGSKAAAFRAIAQARKSVKRFETGRIIPKPVLVDILESTVVSSSYSMLFRMRAT